MIKSSHTKVYEMIGTHTSWSKQFIDIKREDLYSLDSFLSLVDNVDFKRQIIYSTVKELSDFRRKLNSVYNQVLYHKTIYKKKLKV